MISFPRLVFFLQAFAQAVCSAGDSPPALTSQMGLTSPNPSMRNITLPGRLSLSSKILPGIHSHSSGALDHLGESQSALVESKAHLCVC